MLYRVTILMILVRCLNGVSITNESYFRIEPVRPLFGDTVNVSCRMVAPEGYTFYRTEPEVAFDEDSALQCSPSQIGVRSIEGVDTERFSTYRIPDEDRTNVSLIIEIKNFSVADVGLRISCINKLHIQQNYRDERIVISGVLENAAPPPPPTNILVRPPPGLLTCQSQPIVTWDNVPDNRTLTDEPVEHYNVSVNVGGVVQFATVCSGNNPIFVNLEFGSYKSRIQAEVYSINRAGISSPALSNVMEIYRPEIVNLTVREELGLIFLNWKFKTNNPDWLLDVSYSLVVTFRRSVIESVKIFTTNFSLSSDITYYILRTALSTDEVESVTLNRIKICNQVLKYQNNSITYQSYLQNATQNPTQVVIQNTSHAVTQNVSQVTTRNATQFRTQNVTEMITRNETQFRTQNVTEVIITQDTPKVMTTRVPNTHTNELPNHNTTDTSNDVLTNLKNFEYNYVVIIVSSSFIFFLIAVIVTLTFMLVVILFKCHKCIRCRRQGAGGGEEENHIRINP